VRSPCLGRANTRRFSALDNAEIGSSPVMREVVEAALARDAASVAVGTLRGDEYKITAVGALEEGEGAMTFTVKLVRLDGGGAGSADLDAGESYKARSACV
jgi:hypothetical protein